MKTNNWECLRISWVNGNRSAVIDELAHYRKRDILLLMQQAIQAVFDSIPVGTPISGDLQDLREILNRVQP